MSSMRNAVQRRNHKERAQPLERQKWGLLEKHKDYSKRAKDHNRKKLAIKNLQEKASNRNEDEFYFGMVNSESKGGIKTAQRTPGQGGGKTYTKEELELMKTQDVGYLRTVLQRTVKEREKLEEETIIAEKWAGLGSSGNNRVIFGESGEVIHQAQKKEDLETFTDEGSEEETDVKETRPEEEAKLRQLASKRRKVEHLKNREKQLSTALEEVEQQRARMKGTVGGVNKNGVKFKVRRRR